VSGRPIAELRGLDDVELATLVDVLVKRGVIKVA
jgi:hypothetical protein